MHAKAAGSRAGRVAVMIRRTIVDGDLEDAVRERDVSGDLGIENPFPFGRSDVGMASMRRRSVVRSRTMRRLMIRAR
jgi:hypothetical protein